VPSSDRRFASVLPLLLGALALALAACQPLPRPFQPDDKHVSIEHLNALVANSLFHVEPLEGTAEPMDSTFAELLAVELQRREVPATARHLPGERAARSILPVLTTMPPTAGIGPMRIEYRITEADGRTSLIAADELSIAGESLYGGAPDLLASLADRGARRVAEALLRRDPRTAPDTPLRRLRAPIAGTGADDPTGQADTDAPDAAFAEFHVFDVSGAPGDGNLALVRAMRRILRASGVPLAAEMTAESYVLAGAVAMEAEARQQRVIIDWTLFAPDGEEIGTVTVDNLVPAGSLDGPWGAVAEAATAGSAEGMLQLIGAVLDSLPPP